MPKIERITIIDSRVSKSTIRNYARFQLSVTIHYDAEGQENARKATKIVWRRFKEFVLLQDCLRNNNPGCILPPLPPPTLHLSPSRELLERRRVLLQRYLNGVVDHQQLQSDPALWLFVESEDFPEMIKEFRLLEKTFDAAAPTDAIKDSQFHQDELEARLEYLQKITNRLEILKSALSEFFASQQSTPTQPASALTLPSPDMADRITDMGKALSYYIDSTTDGGNHGSLIDLIDSLDTISELLAKGTDQMASADCFTVIIDDHIRIMQEAEQAFVLKRLWRSAIYTLEVRIIDAQAALIRSQNDYTRDFDKNFRLSESFLKMKEELKRFKAVYEALCRRLNTELDRVDARRISETEQGINDVLRNMLEAQKEIGSIWNGFITRIGSLNSTVNFNTTLSY